MRPVLLAVALALPLAGAAAARGASFPEAFTHHAPFDCRQTFAGSGPTSVTKWTVADRGILTLDYTNAVSGDLIPGGYDYRASFLAEGQVTYGSWAWDEEATFQDGPLARPDAGWAVVGRYSPGGWAMPHDDVKGRTAVFVLRSTIAAPAEQAPATDGQEGKDGAQHSYWYCGRHGVVPHRTFAGVIGRVERVTGMKVRLPGWFTQDDPSVTRVRGEVLVAKKGVYGLRLFTRSCRKVCDSQGSFAAKRGLALKYTDRRPVKLARGLRGWINDRGSIAWHMNGVTYAIDTFNAYDVDLIRYANQSIADA